MPIVKEITKDFIPAPAGTHTARCVSVVSLGTQHSPNFPDAFKVQIGFELPNECVTIEGKQVPMILTKDYTCSLSKKANLRKHLDAWRGKPFSEDELKGWELMNILGAPCLLTVIHRTSAAGRTYADIAAISGLPKGMQVPPQVHASVGFEIEEGPESETFKKLPGWVQNKIRASEEWSPTVKAPEPTPAPTSPMTPADGAPVEPEIDDVPF